MKTLESTHQEQKVEIVFLSPFLSFCAYSEVGSACIFFSKSQIQDLCGQIVLVTPSLKLRDLIVQGV